VIGDPASSLWDYAAAGQAGGGDEYRTLNKEYRITKWIPASAGMTEKGGWFRIVLFCPAHGWQG
jgi:hypothetical protein